MSSQNNEHSDFGEPWHDPFSSPNATAQINILNRHNELVRGRVCDQRKIECVNACTGMTDPAAEIAAMREAIKAANEGLHSAMQYILSLPYFGNLEELETTEKVQSALAKLKPFLP